MDHVREHQLQETCGLPPLYSFFLPEIMTFSALTMMICSPFRSRLGNFAAHATKNEPFAVYNCYLKIALLLLASCSPNDCYVGTLRILFHKFCDGQVLCLYCSQVSLSPCQKHQTQQQSPHDQVFLKPRTFPGTTMVAFFSVYLFILLKFTATRCLLGLREFLSNSKPDACILLSALLL